jgi:hypothetical protein
MPITKYIDQIDLSSRAKRKKSVSLAISLLERVRDAEQQNIDNFPTNLQNSDAFANAESSLDALFDAIVSLDDIY